MQFSILYFFACFCHCFIIVV